MEGDHDWRRYRGAECPLNVKSASAGGAPPLYKRKLKPWRPPETCFFSRAQKSSVESWKGCGEPRHLQYLRWGVCIHRVPCEKRPARVGAEIVATSPCRTTSLNEDVLLPLVAEPIQLPAPRLASLRMGRIPRSQAMQPSSRWLPLESAGARMDRGTRSAWLNAREGPTRTMRSEAPAPAERVWKAVDTPPRPARSPLREAGEDQPSLSPSSIQRTPVKMRSRCRIASTRCSTTSPTAQSTWR